MKKQVEVPVVQQLEYGWREVEVSDEERMPPGNSQLSGLWFFSDGVCTPLGWRLPNDDGLIEWNGEWFSMGLTSHSGHSFVLGRGPSMGLGRQYQSLEFESEGKMFSGVGKSDLEVVRALLVEMFSQLSIRLGDGAAGRVLGAMFAYCAAPEIVKKYKCFPGLWLYGPSGSGKSSLAGWLMGVWGMRSVPMAGPVVTAAAIRVALSQYSNLPLWLDDYFTNRMSPAEVAVLHDVFNRHTGVTWAHGGSDSGASRTSLLVTGEVCPDVSTMSRYSVVRVGTSGRSEAGLAWWQRTSPLFKFVGRFLLEHRFDFVGHLLPVLEEWLRDPYVEIPSENDRLVYGVGYAGMVAASRLIAGVDGGFECRVRSAAEQAGLMKTGGQS